MKAWPSPPWGRGWPDAAGSRSPGSSLLEPSAGSAPCEIKNTVGAPRQRFFRRCRRTEHPGRKHRGINNRQEAAGNKQAETHNPRDLNTKSWGVTAEPCELTADGYLSLS